MKRKKKENKRKATVGSLYPLGAKPYPHLFWKEGATAYANKLPRTGRYEFCKC